MIPPWEFANQSALKKDHAMATKRGRNATYWMALASACTTRGILTKPGHCGKAEPVAFRSLPKLPSSPQKVTSMRNFPPCLTMSRCQQRPGASRATEVCISTFVFQKVLQGTFAHEPVCESACGPAAKASQQTLMWRQYGPFSLLRIQGRSTSTHHLHPIQLPKDVQGTMCKAQ